MEPTVDFTLPLVSAKAVVTLYHRQTFDEKLSGGTIHDNGMGFNGVDAPICSSIAEQILAGRPITGKQLRVLIGLLPKYHKQLEEADFMDTPIPYEVEAILKDWGRRISTRKEEGEKPKGQGKLQLREDGKLEFIPLVYPTTALKGTGWGRGDLAQWTWVTNFSIDKVNQVLRLWPDVVLSADLRVKVEQLTTLQEVPEEISEHEILFPFQKESVQFLHSHPRAMLALAPGLGKTACSIFAASIQPDTYRVLVVAPLTLTVNWCREVKKWVGEEAVIWHGKPPYPPGDRWVVTNYDTIRINLPTFQKEDWDLMIVDESVLVKNRKAKRTQAIKDLAREAKVVWELSGAPTTRFYDDLWSQLNILDPARFRSYWRFVDTYCLKFDNGYGISITGNQPDAVERLQEDLADVYFSRTQDQVLDLPDWIFEDIQIPMYDKQWKAYSQMEQRFWAQLPEGDIVLSPNVLSQITRLVQIASNPHLLGAEDVGAKWDAAIEMMEWVEKPAIIWTTFIDTATYLEVLLRKHYRVASLTGSTKQADRQTIVDQFQNGELDVVIAHPGVGKFGLTLTAARTAIYLERSYNGDDYYQSLHRIRRIGTSHSPVVYHLLATDPEGAYPTIDHTINRILRYRKDSAIALTTSLLRENWTMSDDENG